MPTARELLEQADALMRRNRSTATDDIPVLTDSVALPSGQPIAVVTPATARHAEVEEAEAAASAVPVLTESVEVIADDAADVHPVDVAAEGEPSDWLESDRGEPSAIGDAPDSIVIVPSVLRVTPRGEAAAQPQAFEEIELTTPAEAEFDDEFDGEFDDAYDAATEQGNPPVLDLRLGDAPTVDNATTAGPTGASLPDAEREEARTDVAADADITALPPAGEVPRSFVAEDHAAAFADAPAHDARALPSADETFAPAPAAPAFAADAVGSRLAEGTEFDELAGGGARPPLGEYDEYDEAAEADDPFDAAAETEVSGEAGQGAFVASPASGTAVARDDSGAARGAPAQADRDDRRDRAPQFAEGRDAMIAMTLATPLGAAGLPLQATAFRMAPDGGGAASVPYAIAVAVAPPPEPPAPDAAALAAMEAAEKATEQAKWDSLAEEVRMQVLQRIDLFTDTGLRDQLALRLQPIVDRASADLVATINQHIGLMLRGYVAEAIEREIENWRRNQ